MDDPSCRGGYVTDLDLCCSERDYCPGTPKNVTVYTTGTKAGCPIDSDSDGVPDYKDDCPGTPAEELPVNDKGCPIDSDNDGIPDLRDRCPNEGGFIHADGCPVDSDNDDIKVSKPIFPCLLLFPFSL